MTPRTAHIATTLRLPPAVWVALKRRAADETARQGRLVSANEVMTAALMAALARD